MSGGDEHLMHLLGIYIPSLGEVSIHFIHFTGLSVCGLVVEVLYIF